MKKYLIALAVIIFIVLAVFLASCGKSDNKYIGTWQDASDSNATFTISNSDKGLVLQANGESSTLAVTAQDDSLNVDGATFKLDEQKQELSTSGLFDSKIIFRKVAGEQK